MWKLRYSDKLESSWKLWIGCRKLGVFNIDLRLDLNIRALIIASRTYLESGPHSPKFALLRVNKVVKLHSSKCHIQNCVFCVLLNNMVHLGLLVVIFFPSIYSLNAEYLVPNIGMAVWLPYIISQVYADALYIVIIIISKGKTSR